MFDHYWLKSIDKTEEGETWVWVISLKLSNAYYPFKKFYKCFYNFYLHDSGNYRDFSLCRLALGWKTKTLKRDKIYFQPNFFVYRRNLPTPPETRSQNSQTRFRYSASMLKLQL